MDCFSVKKLIPVYLDGELSLKQAESVTQHLMGCPACARELTEIKNAWEMLGELEEIQPQPGFVGRFWTKLSLEKPWDEQFWVRLENEIPRRRWVPAVATVCIVIIVGLFSVRNYHQIQMTDKVLAELSEEDLEMVENMELAENFNLIVELDFFEDLNVIINLDSLET